MNTLKEFFVILGIIVFGWIAEALAFCVCMALLFSPFAFVALIVKLVL